MMYTIPQEFHKVNVIFFHFLEHYFKQTRISVNYETVSVVATRPTTIVHNQINQRILYNKSAIGTSKNDVARSNLLFLPKELELLVLPIFKDKCGELWRTKTQAKINFSRRS